MVLGHLKEIAVPIGDSKINSQPASVVALERKHRSSRRVRYGQGFRFLEWSKLEGTCVVGRADFWVLYKWPTLRH